MTRFARHQTFTAPLFVVIRDFGRIGFESVTNPDDTRESIVRDIATGQIDRVASVLEIVDGTSRDITDEIKDAVEQLVIELAVAA